MADTKPTAAQLAAPPATAAAGAPHRHHRGAPVEEDASKLQFGEFQKTETLTIGEVQTLLQFARNDPSVPPPPDNKVYKSTVEYVNEFASLDANVADQMRSALLARPEFLNNFEIAQIMHLRPEKVEVAVALIPSHGDENEEILQQLLDDVRGFARFGGGGV